MTRTRLLLLATLSSTLIALWPQSTLAACDALNVGACVDAASYGFFHGIAATIWSLDRALLVLAYQIDQIHWWLTTQAFLSAYTALRSVAEPLLAPVATLAVIIGLLLFLLVPVFGRIELINIRQVLMWLIIAPLVLAQAGTWLLTLEETRADIGMLLTGQVSGIAAQGLFGPPNDDPTEVLPSPTPLYPEAGQPSPCANAPVNRPARIGTVAPTDGVRTDDLAAALLLADAQDIHCPAARSPDRDLPDRFYAANGFAVNAADLSSMTDAVQRANAIATIQRGITRLSLGIVACILAVLDALIQCMFSLSLVVIWLAIPIVAVFILFSPSLRPLGLLLQRGVGVIITSWVVGLLLGLLTACLSGAAATGNPTAVIGITMGGVLFAARLLLVAVTTFTDSLGGMGTLIGGAAGIAVAGGVTSVGNLAQRALRAAGGVVTGGVGGAVGAAATAQMAYRATGSGRYAAATALGRIRPVAQLGAVAASMGLVSEEIGSGLYAGERATRSGLGAFARTAMGDAKRTLRDGTTITQRAATRAAERHLRQAQQPTALQRMEHAAAYVGSAAMADDMGRASDAVRDRVQQGGRSLTQGVNAVGQGAVQAVQTVTNPERLGDAAAATITGAVAAIRTRDMAHRPEVRTGMAVRQLPGANRLTWLPRQIPPAHAQTMAAADANRAQLLATGYTIQDGDVPETLSIWQDAPTSGRANRRAGLAQAGTIALRSSQIAQTTHAAIPVAPDAALMTVQPDTASHPPTATSPDQPSAASPSAPTAHAGVPATDLVAVAQQQSWLVADSSTATSVTVEPQLPDVSVSAPAHEITEADDALASAPVPPSRRTHRRITAETVVDTQVETTSVAGATSVHLTGTMPSSSLPLPVTPALSTRLIDPLPTSVIPPTTRRRGGS